MTTTVIQGTPLLAMRWKLFGASPSFDMPYIMRPAPKISLLIAEMLALITMMLRMVAAAGIPRPSKISTNGLPCSPKLFHGKIAISTARVQT